jgi:hypothetical protein
MVTGYEVQMYHDIKGIRQALDRLVTVMEPAALPKAHKTVLDHCTREAWTNLEAGDAHAEADVAADIVQRLYSVYRVRAADDGHEVPDEDVPIRPKEDRS